MTLKVQINQLWQIALHEIWKYMAIASLVEDLPLMAPNEENTSCSPLYNFLTNLNLN